MTLQGSLQASMYLPDLPPNIHFEPLPKTAEASDFAFEVKRFALGPHITVRWDWDEDFQRRFHQLRFDERPLSRITVAGQPAGTIAVTRLSDHIRLDEFYLVPAHQRHGLGTRILNHCLAIADTLGLPVRLQYLKWNPVGSLYRRHGFSQVDETDTHYIMERPPGSLGADRRRPADSVRNT